MRAVTSTALAIAAGALGLGGLLVAPADAAFEIVFQSVDVRPLAGLGTFTLLFNQAPDFDTVDEFAGRPNSFQYEVDTSWDGGASGPLDFESIDWVFRGDEVRLGGTVPIRGPTGSGDGGPTSGGFGPVKDVAPITMDGNRVSFTVDLRALGETDDVFRYRVFALDRGSLTNQIEAAYVPLPPAVFIGAAGMVGAIASRRFVRQL